MLFSEQGDGSLIRIATNETYRHRFQFEARPAWANDRALKSFYALLHLPDGTSRQLRLKVVQGEIKDAREVGPTEKKPLLKEWGQVVQPLPDEIGGDEPPPPRPPRRTTEGEMVATVDFSGRRYAIDVAAVQSRVAELDDGTRFGLFVSRSGMVRSTAILRDEPADAPHGRAWTIAAGERVPVPESLLQQEEDRRADAALVAITRSYEQNHAELELLRRDGDVTPVRPEDLAVLVTSDAKALEVPEKDAPIVNLPLLFWSPGDDSKGPLQTFPLRGVVLGVFRVPVGFGSADRAIAEGGEIVVKARFAAFVLTTCEGVVVSTRDQKHFQVPAGSIVWVDLKSDLRPLKRYAPVFGDNAIIKAHELLITPKHKVKFSGKNIDTGATEPHYAWRIDVRYLRKIIDPRALAVIAAFSQNCPEVPTGDEVEEIDGDGNEDGDGYEG